MKAKKIVKRLQDGPSSDQSSNRLLLRLLMEMKEDAAAKKHPTHIYNNMMNAVKEYDYELTTAEEIIQVKGIGKKTCEKLVKKMELAGDVRMKNVEDDDRINKNMKTNRKVIFNDEENRAGPSGVKTDPKVSKDNPKQVKVNLNDIIILSIMDGKKESLTKTSIVSEAEKYCDYLLEGHSEETCDKTTLWPAMLSLLEKKFVDKKGYHYKLTDIGAKFINQRRTENPANSKFENILLEEILQEADEKNKAIFNEALVSLQRCPVTLNSGNDCRRLLNFDRHICSLLNKLDINKKSKNLPLHSHDEEEEQKTDSEEDTNVNMNANKVVQPPAKGRSRAAPKVTKNLKDQEEDHEGMEMSDEEVDLPTKTKKANRLPLNIPDEAEEETDSADEDINTHTNKVVRPLAKGRTRAATKGQDNEDETERQKKKDGVATRPAKVKRTQATKYHKDRQDHQGMEVEDEESLESDEESIPEREINMDINPSPIPDAKHRQGTNKSNKGNMDINPSPIRDAKHRQGTDENDKENMDINPPPIRDAKHGQDFDESDKENDLTMEVENGDAHITSTW